MHAISSYRGNRPTHTYTNKQTHRQDRLQYTAPLSLARSVITVWLLVSFSSTVVKVVIVGTVDAVMSLLLLCHC